MDVLDGIRAVCVLLIGWYHIWQQSWISPCFTVFGHVVSLDFLLRAGYLFVDCMLLLSALVLYLPHARGEKGKLWTFYKKRLIRIVPSYLLCVIPQFIVYAAQGRYSSFGFALKDILTHLTFTQNLFYDTAHLSPINGALWTVAVEMQFYLIFPLLARCFEKNSLLTWLGMTLTALAFRYCAAQSGDSTMYFNQMPAFLDVFANGFLTAEIYVRLRRRLGNEKWETGIRLFFTFVGVLCIGLMVTQIREQAWSNGQEGIRLGQMSRRWPLSALFSCVCLCAAGSLTGVRLVLGGGAARFLAGISYNFYIWHQWLAVKIKEWGIVPSLNEEPWVAGEYAWQVPYTVVCFLGALLMASAVTFLIEKPAARLLSGGKKGRKAMNLLQN